MIVEKKVSELVLGQYIVDIVEQKGNYNLKGSGHIKASKVLNHLTDNGVISVLIDTNKTLIASKNKEGDTVFKPPQNLLNKQESVKIELDKAKKIFNESKAIQRQIFSDAVDGKALDLGAVEDITDKTIDTIFQNSDALACILNIRIKDEYLLEHSVSVSILMTIFAKHLKLEKKLIQQLSVGAFLHDVGKIMIPDEILNKPGRLTDEEFEVMKSHASHSIDILSNTPNLSKISLEVAALHHEKINGAGYPHKLAGEEISKYGRMIAICDIFDALTAHRCYKEGFTHVKAFTILRKLAENNELDPILVDHFIQCMGVYPVGSLVELGSHRLAIVEQRNESDPIKPKVRAFYNMDSRDYTMTEDIDLSKSEDNIIKSAKADEFDLDMNRIVEFLMMQG